MQTPLKISALTVDSSYEGQRVFDMTGRCGFAICLKGDFDVKIVNRQYHVGSHCILLCLPFVSVEIVKVTEPGELIAGGIALDDVLTIVNRTVDTSNLLAIDRHPLVLLNEAQYSYIKSSVDEYQQELAESVGGADSSCDFIYQAVIKARIQLLIAQVLKLYFTNMPMDVRAHNHRDMVSQRFIIEVYANCRSRRDVRFYAERSGLSLKYFSTIVHELTGIAASQWIETAVVGEAKYLLQHSDGSVKEIAASLNFPDASTFTKYFVRVAGTTPRQYRRSVAPD